jgi:DNA mismatch endonuclease, patch repair protein
MNRWAIFTRPYGSDADEENVCNNEGASPVVAHTTPELTVRRLVHSMGYRYRLHVRSLPGNPDLVFPRLRCIINVNGCFWHLHGCARCRVPSSRRRYWVGKLHRNAARDKRTRRELRQSGWRVLVIWECQVGPPHVDRLRAKIAGFLDKKVKRPSRKKTC